MRALTLIFLLLFSSATWSAGFTANDHAFRGSWYDPAMSGQGVLVDIIDLGTSPAGTPLGKVMFAGWYVYTADGSDKLWLTAQGRMAGDGRSQALTLFLTAGGRFNAPPAVNATAVGEAIFTLQTDGRLRVDFGFDNPDPRWTQNGSMTLVKMGDSSAVVGASRGLRGSWYDPVTSGQGVQIDVIGVDGSRVAFVAWYLYTNTGKLLWLTAAGPELGAGGGTLTLYENTGGRFNAPPITQAQEVGTVTLSVDAAGELRYAFVFHRDDPRWQRSGVIKMVKARPSVDWSNVVDTNSREAVKAAYAVMTGPRPSMDWTGNVSGCVAGSTSAAHRSHTLRVLNLLRGFAGVPALVEETDPLVLAQQQAAALIVQAGTLSHTPDPSAPCYTAAGARGARVSNLASGANGVPAVGGFLADRGAANWGVGHRIGLLTPNVRTFAAGDTATSSAMALNDLSPVIDRDQAVAWPSAGYFPYLLVPPRWSFSLANTAADFREATVTLRNVQTGQLVPVTLEPLVTGATTLRTIVWVTPTSLSARPATDAVYEVSVSNVKVDGHAKNFTYRTIVFDPS